MPQRRNAHDGITALERPSRRSVQLVALSFKCENYCRANLVVVDHPLDRSVVVDRGRRCIERTSAFQLVDRPLRLTPTARASGHARRARQPVGLLGGELDDDTPGVRRIADVNPERAVEDLIDLEVGGDLERALAQVLGFHDALAYPRTGT